MSSQRVGTISALALALGLVLLATSWFSTKSQAASRAAASSLGRYTIVNGTPSVSQNIMLLDTVTGESWIACKNVNASTGWCHLWRSDAPTGGGSY